MLVTSKLANSRLPGANLLVRPVTEPGVTSVKVYLPGRVSKTLWYDVDSYKAIPADGYMHQEVNMGKVILILV